MAAMENVLDLYAEPYDPQRPVVCFDETTTQLLADLRPSIPAAPGRPRREDYEYLRAGTRNLFLTCEPRRGWQGRDAPGLSPLIEGVPGGGVTASGVGRHAVVEGVLDPSAVLVSEAGGHRG